MNCVKGFVSSHGVGIVRFAQLFFVQLDGGIVGHGYPSFKAARKSARMVIAARASREVLP